MAIAYSTRAAEVIRRMQSRAVTDKAYRHIAFQIKTIHQYVVASIRSPTSCGIHGVPIVLDC
jgi:hypothetical protein